MSSFKNVSVTLGWAVATSGTFTLTYPTGTDAAWFISGVAHKLTALGAEFTAPTDFRISAWGADTATVTWLNASTLPAGTTVRIQLNIPGPETYRKERPVVDDRVRAMDVKRIILGTPITADADGVRASQGGTTLIINGALASGGEVEFDVPRNVVAAWTGTAVCTVTGADDDGNTLVESSASGTSLAGKKAFKKVTGVSFSTSVTGATVGSGTVLGIPVYIGSTDEVFGHIVDGATATDGTVVAGLDPNTASTATTADVRGTVSPNSAPNGTRAYELLVALSNPDYDGNPQYAG